MPQCARHPEGLRIALFTLDSAISGPAVATFVAAHAAEIVLIGRSLPFRPGEGGPLRQAWRHLRRSGPRLLPYLWVNYALPPRQKVRAIGAARGIPVLELADVNGAAAAAAIRAARPDVLVACHFDQIFAPATLALAPLGGINLHPSLLPRHRGPVPTIWALAEEPPDFGVSIHRIAPRIDAGAILAQRRLALPPGTTASAAARALHLAGIPLLSQVLAGLAGAAVLPPAEPILPYCPFPPASLLRSLAARRRRLVDAVDLQAVLGAHDPDH